MTLRTRFALNAEDTLVDIADLSRDTRHLLGPFRCAACKSPVIPALGEKVAHYFRHRRDRECHGETYLHRTAKFAFLEAFTKAVAEGRPYPVQRPRPVVCRRHEEEFGLSCSFEPELETFDLTRWVSQAAPEATVKERRADVLLQNRDASVELFIEIEVTHACEPAKIASGVRIMEIPIASDEDIARLREGIVLDGVRGRGINLAERSPRERSDCAGCPTQVGLFLVFEGGTSMVADYPLADAHRQRARDDVIHSAVLPSPVMPPGMRPIEVITLQVMTARFEQKVPVKSCTLCRYGAPSWQPAPGYLPMRCAKRQCLVGHDEAADCDDYYLFASKEQLLARRDNQKRRFHKAPSKSSFAPARGSIWD